MLVFAAHLPHSPLLLPSVNKDQIQKVKKTLAAIETLAEELYAARPDTILLFSEHPTIYPDAFSINVQDPYRFDMSHFGQMDHAATLHPDLLLIDKLQRSLRATEQPFTLSSDEALSYASAVPLELMTNKLQKVKLIPLTYSELDAKQHFVFGQALKDEIFAYEKRVAVLAAGDASHALSSQAPAAYHPDGPVYDAKIQELIANKNSTGLLRMNQEMVEHAKETNYRVLCLLFGLLERVSVDPKILSYESPFGVGYLTAHFVIQ